MTPNRNVKRPMSLRHGAGLALGLSAALVAGEAGAQTAPATDEKEVELETIRIEDRTGDVNPYTQKGAPYKARVSGDNRRPLPLAETPATIQVITQTQIRESGRNDLRAILDAQPGVTVGTGENGNAFGDRYIIRGQEAKSDVFIDGLRDPGLQSREVFALEQIEITKGPSATFAGRGASGGAINGITKQASTEYSFHAIDVTGGTQDHIRATLDSNVRISDVLAVRANLMYMDEDVPKRDPARRRRYGAALAATAQISDTVSVLADYYHVTVRDRQDLGQAIANVSLGGQPFYDIPAYAQKEDFQNASVNVLTGRVRAELFEGFTLENAARYGRTTNGYINTSVARFTRGAGDPTAPGAIDYRLNTSRAGWQEIDFFADRLNLVGTFETGALKHNLVTGVEYTTYSVDNRFGALNPSPAALVATPTSGSGYAYTISGATNCVNGAGTTLNAWCVTDGRGNLLDNRDSIFRRTGISRNGSVPSTTWKVETTAGYLMDSIDLTDKLTLSGGVRFDAFDFQLVSYNLTTAAATTDYKYSGTIWSYNAGLSFKPIPGMMAYIAWATGADINGGESDVGTNCGYGGLCTATVAGQTVYQGKPERSDNFELGTKMDLFDNRLLLTTSIFQTTKKDIFEGGTNSYLATGSLNSGELRIRGLELGLAGNITTRLSGQIGAAFMTSEVRKSVIDPARVGRRIANFANDSVDAQLRYDFTDRLAIGGNVTYQSSMYGGQPDSAAAFNAAFNAYSIRVPEYTTYGAFASYRLNDNFTLRVNGLNLTDKRYFAAAYQSGSFAYLGDARTYRATLSAKF
jgi:catecholate siderophore receptor